MRYANPTNLFNNAALNANFLRTAYPGMGRSTCSSTDGPPRPCKYNALQLSANRRLSQGLSMGAAYTLAKGEG